MILLSYSLAPKSVNSSHLVIHKDAKQILSHNSQKETKITTDGYDKNNVFIKDVRLLSAGAEVTCDTRGNLGPCRLHD